jgi:uncharacterized membrane protein
MVPLLVLIGSFVLLRVLGAAGVGLLDSGHALRGALACMFLLTASAHWGRMRADLVRMVPPRFANPERLVTLTGVLELLGALGLLLPYVYRIAAVGLALLLVALFPANVHAARAGLTLRGRPATPLAPRTALQVVFIGALLLVALK